MPSDFGKIQIYTGDGKGKTTAALGLVIRALGQNKRAAIVYFDKGGGFYGGRKILDKLTGENFNYYARGFERFGNIKKGFRFGVTDGDKQEAKRALDLVGQLFKENNVDLLVLDEINPAIHLGMVELEDFLEILKSKPGSMELVLTGRYAPEALLAKADLITEMKAVKHYLTEGAEAREGIEF
jgi:cob(I)alamin adenosyltransferase